MTNASQDTFAQWLHPAWIDSKGYPFPCFCTRSLLVQQAPSALPAASQSLSLLPRELRAGGKVET